MKSNPTLKEATKGKLMLNRSLYIPGLTVLKPMKNITCILSTFDMSSGSMKSTQMIALTKFHAINPCNVCTAIIEEISGNVKSDEIVSCVLCATLHFI